MKKYSFSFFILCLSILCTQTVFTQTQTPSLLTQASESTKDTGTQTQSEVINPSDSREIFDQLKNSCNRLSTTIEQLEYQFRSEEFIKHRITIVELNELIERVQEDMKTRFALLNRSDKAEILKVIKEKEEALLKHLLDMETYLNPELYANKKKSSVKKIILTTCGITAAAVFLICLYIASVDTDQNCWTRPTFARFRSNLAALFNHQAPTQQPTAAAEPPAQQPPAPVLPPVSDEIVQL